MGTNECSESHHDCWERFHSQNSLCSQCIEVAGSLHQDGLLDFNLRGGCAREIDWTASSKNTPAMGNKSLLSLLRSMIETGSMHTCTYLFRFFPSVSLKDCLIDFLDWSGDRRSGFGDLGSVLIIGCVLINRERDLHQSQILLNPSGSSELYHNAPRISTYNSLLFWRPRGQLRKMHGRNLGFG